VNFPLPQGEGDGVFLFSDYFFMTTSPPLRAGIIGFPVAHSRSPLLHTHWLKRHGIHGSYEAMPVPPHELEAVLRGLARNGFRGCNVTVPHKENALRYMDSVDDLAQLAGAVNTVVVQADGSLTGRNTDVYGFSENLEGLGKAWKKKAPALVIGAGGAARAIIVALMQAGCADIRLANRTSDRAIELAREMKGKGANITPVGWPDRYEAMEKIGLLVNTSTGGMIGTPPLDLDLRDLPDGAVVTDIVYTPLLTPLLLEARRRGHAMMDGLGMLLHQAVPGFAAWFGVTPLVDAETRALVEKTL
jgi:shikimate dehydrogenase